MTKQRNRIILFSSLLLVNLLVVDFYSLQINHKKIFIINSFLFLLSFFSNIIKERVIKNKKIVFYKISINFLRILACIIFLFLTILEENKTNRIYVYNFLIIYFTHLFFEIFLEYRSNKNKA